MKSHLLYKASEKYDYSLPIIEYLIEHGADVNGKGSYNPLLHACERDKQDLIKCLIKHGANVNQEDRFGNTPLSEFIRSNYGIGDIINELVDHGADIEKESKDGNTPLIIACKMNHRYLEDIVKVLIEYGANVNKENLKGKTALYFARKYNNDNVVKYLIEHGAK